MDQQLSIVITDVNNQWQRDKTLEIETEEVEVGGSCLVLKWIFAVSLRNGINVWMGICMPKEIPQWRNLQYKWIECFFWLRTFYSLWWSKNQFTQPWVFPSWI
jgi:hypothetical protein